MRNSYSSTPPAAPFCSAFQGPSGDPLTHALAIAPQTGEIYVSSGNGIEIC
ncbi:MAG: hypothetical protein U1E96_02560 [Azonexus sp.]